MTLPWESPNGNGARVYPPTIESSAASVESFRRSSSLLARASRPHFEALCDSVMHHRADPQRDTYTEGEVWTLRFDHERMERWVRVRSWHSEWLGEDAVEIELSSLAIWNQFDATSGRLTYWPVREPRRWIGLTTRTKVSVFAESLDLVFDDAKRYTTADLNEQACGSPEAPRGRPWRA
jgi:hypothetical protein